MKLAQIDFRPSVDVDVQEALDRIRIIINQGRYQLQVVDTAPTWSANDGELAVYAGASDYRLYAHIGGAWRNLSWNTEGTIVDGAINIGSYLKADNAYGFWLGDADFASAPFKVNLDGVVTATSGTIGGWTLSTDKLSGGTGSNYVALIPGTGIQLGSETFASAPFSVTKEGVLKSTSGTIGGWTIGASSLSSTNITIDSGNELIKSNDYASGPLGKGWQIDATQAEFQNIVARGRIKTSVFEKDTISCINGITLISSADVLADDMTALDADDMSWESGEVAWETGEVVWGEGPSFEITITGETTFFVDEIIRIKDGADDEWFRVIDTTNAPTYQVARDLGAGYDYNDNPTWTKGTAIVSMGRVGKGFILFDSSSANSPVIQIHERNSTTYNDYTEYVRLGQLNGFLGYGSDAIGIAIGETDKYLKYDPTNGLRIKGTITATSGSFTGTINIGSTGKVYIDGANEVIKVYDASGNLRVELGLLS